MADKAIMWDFDGTLAYRDGLWSGCLAAVLQEHEPERGITRDDVRPFLRRGFPWHTPDVAHPELSTPEAWWGVIDAVMFDACRRLGIPADRAQRYAREANERYVDVSGFRLFDDTLPVLRSLREDGWRHVILSNHVPELRDLVEGLELADLVDEVLSSALTGYEKPHPEAFALGRAAAGDPAELWMVGDNPHADVAGAEAVGIPAILVRTNGDVERRSDDLHGVARLLMGREGIGVRTALPGEAEAIFRLQRASALAAFSHIFDPELHPYPDEPERERYRSYIDDDATTVFVALAEDRFVGVAVVQAEELVRLFVSPDRWGRGIGSRLHDEVLSSVRADGSERCRLWVLEENRRARRFYESRGWTFDGRTRRSTFPPYPPALGYTVELS